jgi:hypothetical protein
MLAKIKFLTQNFSKKLKAEDDVPAGKKKI